ncbi:MAG: ferric reductase-like transmembrane domain-containing protein [Candidatus Izemoplasmataceae bacterium]
MILFEYFGLLLILPIALVFIKFGPMIHKHEFSFYLITLIISLVLISLIMLGFNVRSWPFIYDLFYSGHLSFALFTLLMGPGIFKHKSKLKILFLRIRRELAILGFIALLPHAIFRMNLALSGYNFTGLIAFILMIPLVLTSLPRVRKKMHPRTWYKVHYLAYIVYFMIYFHLSFNIIVRSNFYFIDVKPTGLPYIVLFVIYVGIKIKRAYNKYQSKTFQSNSL